MVFITAMETMNRFHYCYGDKEWFSLLLWRKGMVFTTTMETMNPFHYCYGDEQWFSLLLLTQAMVFSTTIIIIIYNFDSHFPRSITPCARGGEEGRRLVFVKTNFCASVLRPGSLTGNRTGKVPRWAIPGRTNMRLYFVRGWWV